MGALGLPPVPELPRPLPWLGRMGPVAPLDASRTDFEQPLRTSASAEADAPAAGGEDDSGASGAKVCCM